MESIIVTGASGFVGFHVSLKLLARGFQVIGLDVMNDYYDVNLKQSRLSLLQKNSRFIFHNVDICHTEFIKQIMSDYSVLRVVHLAAQAGVRYSLSNPFAYEHSNIRGHLSVLEACRSQENFEHLVYASSSSVYGDRPSDGSAFRETDIINNPSSLYAASKISCELMSQSYANLFKIPQSGLRFFTVYGPWGRPDMAYYIFSDAMRRGKTIDVFGEGKMARDFTFVDDIVDGILGVLFSPPTTSNHEVYNIGNSRPEGLLDMIEVLETCLGIQAKKNFLPMQPGDVTHTYADISKLKAKTGYVPKVSLTDGLNAFANWYKDFQPTDA